MSTAIHLTRANGFGPLPALLEARAGERAVLGAFQAEGIPFAVVDALETPIPLRAMVGLLDRAAHHLGDRTFGLELGERMAANAFGCWVLHGATSPTLAVAIRRLSCTINLHQTGAHLELATHEDHFVLRHVMPLFERSIQTHADHIIAPMLMLCRRYLGMGWRPREIELNYPRDPDAARLEERLGVPVRFGGRGVGVALEAADLAQPLRFAPPPGSERLTVREVVAEAVLADAPEPARAISALVALRLFEGETDIDGTARMAGLSVQALQRKLRDKGYSYRDIVGLARRRRAEALLRETDMPVLEVALALGYDDHANFTRAFRRWVGCTPSHYRASARAALPFPHAG